MAFALTGFQAYGIESDEAVTKKFTQFLRLDITAANTDVDLDIGDYSGTFWTAVTGSDPGDTALKVVKDIQTRAKQFLFAGGQALQALTNVGASYPVVQTLNASATSGGGATETLTVTGLPASAVILNLQRVSGGNAVSVVGNGAVSANQIASVVFSGDPGAGAIVRVTYLAVDSTPAAGSYTLAMDSTNGHLPDILFASGSAPTSYQVYLWWDLNDQAYPIYLSQ